MLPKQHAVRAFLMPLLFLTASMVCSGFAPSEASASEVTLRWDYTTSGAAGFILYCGPASRDYRGRTQLDTAK